MSGKPLPNSTILTYYRFREVNTIAPNGCTDDEPEGKCLSVPAAGNTRWMNQTDSS